MSACNVSVASTITIRRRIRRNWLRLIFSLDFLFVSVSVRRLRWDSAYCGLWIDCIGRKTLFDSTDNANEYVTLHLTGTHFMPGVFSMWCFVWNPLKVFSFVKLVYPKRHLIVSRSGIIYLLFKHRELENATIEQGKMFKYEIEFSKFHHINNKCF